MVYITVSVTDSDIELKKNISSRNFRQYINTVRDFVKWVLYPDPEGASFYYPQELNEVHRIQEGLLNGELRASEFSIRGKRYPVNDMSQDVPSLPIFPRKVHLKLDYCSKSDDFLYQGR